MNILLLEHKKPYDNIHICCCYKNDHDALMSVFYFIDTSISKHVDIFIVIGFRLRTSEVQAWGSWYVQFASCFYINIYCIMGCYYTLCHNTYGYSLLFYKVYMKRENAGSWGSGLEKEQILETYSAQLQKSWNFTEVIFGINKNTGERKYQRGPTPWPRGWGRTLAPWARPLPCGPPGSPPVTIFYYMKSFTLKKKW